MRWSRNTFSRHNYSGGPTNPGPETVAGYGQYAHRDGYNVLYGDWSAKWVGDPQLKIMWGYAQVCKYRSGAMSDGLAQNGITRFIEQGGSLGSGLQRAFLGAGNVAWTNDVGAVDVWHAFDSEAGVDQ